MKRDGYRVQLAGRNEAVEYEDDVDVYRFGVTLHNKTWTVILPPTKGNDFRRHPLSAEEASRILPRVSTYLSRIWWLGFFPRSYRVEFQREL